jgi:glycosyltransferase involved in cell wall biosynthesis
LRNPTFTVFTPTYNRAHTLRRPFESLLRQTRNDFEWLVVDDGSTDGTEGLIRGWESAAGFPVRYLRQDNRGKHQATNRAVKEARGALFATLDSDDACEPDALQSLLAHWHGIPASRRDRFSGVIGRCRYPSGRPVGRPLPEPVLDTSLLDLRYRLGIRDERWGFTRTELLLAFPFPDITGRGYLPEGLVWDRIALRYSTRFVDDIVRVYHFAPGASSLGTPDEPERLAWGNALHQEMVLNEQLRWFPEAPVEITRAAVHFVRFSLHLGRGPAEQRGRLSTVGARALWLAAFPAGWALYRADRRVRGDS